MNYPQGPQGYSPPRVKPVWSPPIAAVLAGGGAALMGMYGLLFVWSALSGLRTAAGKRPTIGADDWRVARLEQQLDVVEHQIDLGVGGLLAVLLGVGGVLVLARRPHGLTMVIIGSGLAILALWGVGANTTTTGSTVVMGVYSLLPIGALIGAFLPSTQRWIDSRNTHVMPANIPRPPVPPYN